MLDLFCDFQILVKASCGLIDIVFESSNRRVDIVRQRGKLLIISHINGHVQIAFGDLSKGVVDFADILDDQFLDQHKDIGKQCGKYQRFHKGQHINGCTLGEECFCLTHDSDDVIAFGFAIHQERGFAINFSGNTFSGLDV